MSDKNDESFYKGFKAAWVSILAEALQKLGYRYEETNRYGWILEREAAILQLRELCEKFGNNDWDDTLNLSDIIEKHLGYYLDKENE